MQSNHPDSYAYAYLMGRPQVNRPIVCKPPRGNTLELYKLTAFKRCVVDVKH